MAMKLHGCCIVLAAFALALFGRVAHGQSVTLDNFDSGLRLVGGAPLWNIYSGEGAVGTVATTGSAAKSGPNGLQATLSAGTMYGQFLPNDGSVWIFAHNLLQSGTWTTNTFNRMSFWVMHPPGHAVAATGQHNIEFGTYVRCQLCDPTNAESGGWHYYHYFNIPPGVWTYVVVDNHPQHSRSAGPTGPGVITSPTIDGPTWNYFDALTRFYWNAPYISPSSYPAPFYWDSFQIYVDPNLNEDIASIASLEASFNPATNRLHVGFTRNATEDAASDTTYTARYAFSDIWQLGFANAALMGTVGPDGLGDYVNKQIESTTINLAGRTMVYIAVQRQGKPYFRQIALPLNALPAPGNLRVLNP